MKTSQLFQALIKGLEEQMIKVIKSHLNNETKKIEFLEEAQMSFYPEYTMTSISTRINKINEIEYHVNAEHTSGKRRRFDLEDTACVPITDLEHILRQIEM